MRLLCMSEQVFVFGSQIAESSILQELLQLGIF
jgi:hypothetical protein